MRLTTLGALILLLLSVCSGCSRITLPAPIPGAVAALDGKSINGLWSDGSANEVYAVRLKGNDGRFELQQIIVQDDGIVSTSFDGVVKQTAAGLVVSLRLPPSQVSSLNSAHHSPAQQEHWLFARVTINNDLLAIYPSDTTALVELVKTGKIAGTFAQANDGKMDDSKIAIRSVQQLIGSIPINNLFRSEGASLFRINKNTFTLQRDAMETEKKRLESEAITDRIRELERLFIK
jgi:hypothetical protein